MLTHVHELAAATEPCYSAGEVATRVGLPVETVRRVSRALGFPEPSEEDRPYSDEDVRAFNGVARMLDTGFATLDTVLQVARVVGHGASRIAAAQASALQEVAASYTDDDVDESQVVVRLDAIDETLPFLEHALLQTWRRHFATASGTAGAANRDTQEAAIGFLDLVGFTAVTRSLSSCELAMVVDRFETLCFDTVPQAGARIVKFIGDEVMFVADDADSALATALELIGACHREPTLPPARAGIDLGPYLTMGGDYYGETVNFASRLVAAATPDTVLVSDATRQALSHNTPWWRLRGRMLKGVGLRPAWEFSGVPRRDPFRALLSAIETGRALASAITSNVPPRSPRG